MLMGYDSAYIFKRNTTAPYYIYNHPLRFAAEKQLNCIYPYPGKLNGHKKVFISRRRIAEPNS